MLSTMYLATVSQHVQGFRAFLVPLNASVISSVTFVSEPRSQPQKYACQSAYEQEENLSPWYRRTGRCMSQTCEYNMGTRALNPAFISVCPDPQASASDRRSCHKIVRFRVSNPVVVIVSMLT